MSIEQGLVTLDITPEEKAEYLSHEEALCARSAQVPLTEAWARRARILGQRNIIGFGIGVKEVNGVLRPDLGTTITGFVVKKAPQEKIESGFDIASIVREVFGRDMQTDVVEVGILRAH